MTLASMTGFGRAESSSGAWKIGWELRSVNGKGLDIRARTPNSVEGLDQLVRARIQKALRRGNVSVNLQLEQDTDAGGYQINREWLSELKQVTGLDGCDDPQVTAQLLGIKGVVEPAGSIADEDDIAARDKAIDTALEQAIAALKAARQAEGARLQHVLEGIIGEIMDLTEAATRLEAASPGTRRARLQSMLSDLLQADPALPEDRLAQELALQMTRGDITEELDRLRAHVAQARGLLQSDEPVGRRFDFLAQEFNREANTLCSKSSDIDLTRIGMDMKVAIDRLREQVQNIE